MKSHGNGPRLSINFYLIEACNANCKGGKDMSSNDQNRKPDTVMAAALRKAGIASVLPNDPKANSHRPRSQVHVPGVQRQSAFNDGSEYSTEVDLHGCSEDRAYEKLENFIRECALKGYRQVLVITGKGTGKLKRLVPFWLEVGPFKEFVADVCVADPWDGGDGALYVRLRVC